MVLNLSDIREPTPPPEVLDRVEAFVRRFLILPDEHAYVAVALWVAHSWVLDGFDTTPRLAFLSPEPGSGKSRSQDVLALLVPRPLRAFNVSVPVLFRSMVDEHNEPVPPPTIFLHEVDAIFGPRAKGDDEPLRAFANAGHTRGVLVQRIATRGNRHIVETFPAFAPMSLAGLKDLPQTVMDRSVVVRMARKAPGEVVAKFREKYARAEAEALRADLFAWATGVDRDALDLDEDALPDCLENRQGDVWEPLIACADAAGGRWPLRAREAAIAFTTTAPGGEESLGVRLLADLRTVFGSAPVMATADLLRCLHELDEAPWSDLYGKPLDSRGLAKRLHEHGVHSKTVRIGAATHKGYERAALAELWTRYLPALPTCAGCGEPMPYGDLNGDGLHPTCTPTERNAS